MLVSASFRLAEIGQGQHELQHGVDPTVLLTTELSLDQFSTVQCECRQSIPLGPWLGNNYSLVTRQSKESVSFVLRGEAQPGPVWPGK